MCGIVGAWDFDGRLDPGTLLAMRRALRHRGPDDEGEYTDLATGVHLGHTRLAILDLSPLGKQPMSTDDGIIWITFNGEVYNFREIRGELEARGYRFTSHSDTEVILKAYQEWGVESVSRFRGMFAYAIWDSRRRELFLVRDRAGVKPFYYFFDGRLLVFGSELKALLPVKQVSRKIRYSALAHYLQYGYVSSPDSIFEGIRTVKPGHWMVLNDAGVLNETKYWDISNFYQQGAELERSGYWGNRREEEVEEELEALLLESFRYRLVSDVPVGLFLSGGIDSSLVAAILARKAKENVRTFTIGYHEPEFNEATWARKVAHELGTDHTELYCGTDEALSAAQRIADLYDEPFGDNSGIPTYLVSALARRHVKVALSADAGDELFCGYTRYRVVDQYLRYAERIPSILLHVSRPFFDMLPLSVYERLPVLRNHGHGYAALAEKLLKLKRLIGTRGLAAAYRAATTNWSGDELASLLRGTPGADDGDIAGIFSGLDGVNRFHQMMCLDFKKYMMDDILVKVDRASMAVGLEAREPFLDHKLAEYAARLPLEYKYRHGESKYILRRILRRYLPVAYIDRPKQGFAAPIDRWMRHDLRHLVDTYLARDRIVADGIFDADVIDRSVKQYRRGIVASAHNLWYLIEFQMWKERWLNA
jgi:asparagine synthase (glutamine-hydrolysing)